MTIYTKWFKVEPNVVSYRLSKYYMYLSNINHECLLDKFAKSQVSSNFRIRKLPSKITYFASLILWIFPVKNQWFVKQKKGFSAWRCYNNFLVGIGIQESYFLGGMSDFLQTSPYIFFTKLS